MRLMQICTNFLPGGIQRHVLDLTADLRAHGHSVVLVGDGGQWQAADDDPDYIPLGLNGVTDRGGSLPARLWSLAKNARLLRRAVQSRKIDLIHAHETAPTMVAKLATLGLNIPIVMTFHGSAPDRVHSAARIARHCTQLTISPSRSSLDAMIANGLPTERGRVMGLGVAQFPTHDPQKVASLRRHLLGSDGTVLILSLSRLDHQKGIDTMVEVACRVTDQRKDVIFAVAGGGRQTDQVKSWIADAGLVDNFKLLGPVSNVAEHLLASDLHLLTSRWENLPISIVESFRAGLPVIATDCGGVSELVDSTVGALCPIDNVEALTAAVLELASDPKMRHLKGAAALERSKEGRFSPDLVHRGFEQAYEDLLSGAPIAPSC